MCGVFRITANSHVNLAPDHQNPFMETMSSGMVARSGGVAIPALHRDVGRGTWNLFFLLSQSVKI